MSVGKMLVEQLRQFVAQESATTEHTLTAHDDATLATLAFDDFDRYSVALRALTVGAGAVPTDDVRSFLSATAAEVARRLSYLEEPLAVWELDSDECLVQLRSSPPQRENDEISYWEVVLNASEQPSARITRYRWTPDMVEREALAYPATFALVARITDSLATALRPEEMTR